MPTDDQIRAAAVQIAAQHNILGEEPRVTVPDKSEIQRAHDGTAWVACYLRVSPAEASEQQA